MSVFKGSSYARTVNKTERQLINAGFAKKKKNTSIEKIVYGQVRFSKYTRRNRKDRNHGVEYNEMNKKERKR